MDMDYFWAKHKTHVIISSIILVLIIAVTVFFVFIYEPPKEPEPEPDVVTSISVELGGEDKYKEKITAFVLPKEHYIKQTNSNGTSFSFMYGENSFRFIGNIPNNKINKVDISYNTDKTYIYYTMSDAAIEEMNQAYIEKFKNELTWEDIFHFKDAYVTAKVLDETDVQNIILAHDGELDICTDIDMQALLGNIESLLRVETIPADKISSGIYDEITNTITINIPDCTVTYFFENNSISKCTYVYTDGTLTEIEMIKTKDNSVLTSFDTAKEYSSEDFLTIVSNQLSLFQNSTIEDSTNEEELDENSVS